MRDYLIRRLLQLVPLVIAVSLLIYFIIDLAPGDPLEHLLLDPDIKMEDIERLKEIYGVGGPFLERWGKWFWRLIRYQDLGVARFHPYPVWDLILHRIPVTLRLSLLAMAVSLAVALPVGIFSARRQYSGWDNIFTGLAFFGRSMPTFWFGIMLILIFGIYLGGTPIELPMGGLSSIVFPEGVPWITLQLNAAKHHILPVLVLGLAGMTGWTRYVRSTLLEVLGQDYIRTARAKGLSERVVIWKHAFRNVLIPLITLVALTLPALFAGAIITETVFALPGMGRLIFTAVVSKDFNLAVGCLTFLCILTIVSNLLADIMYAVVDPRVRFS
ncbi:MAG: Dipeptide transport system permease protein DppB [candidate division WS2 bacterium]|nr:Dipeptide transport system permease protein DppB [Candidatus Lithacetigena glycinireducens]